MDKDIALELEQLLFDARATEQRVARARTVLNAEEAKLRKAVEAYGTKRQLLIKNELARRNLVFCTECGEFVRADTAKLIFTEGVERYSGGYENSEYGHRNFARYHCACQRCAQRLLDRHGWRGVYNVSLDSQEKFDAFVIEKQGDEHMVRKFGAMVTVKQGDINLVEPTTLVVEELVRHWDLPPRIGLDNVEGRYKEIVVYERAVAKSVAA